MRPLCEANNSMLHKAKNQIEEVNIIEIIYNGRMLEKEDTALLLGYK